MITSNTYTCRIKYNYYHGCALAEPGGPRCLTFALGRQENLRFFIQIICWAPYILQFQNTGLPPIFLRAQLCLLTKREVNASRPRSEISL